jgi:hypothetical protein
MPKFSTRIVWTCALLLSAFSITGAMADALLHPVFSSNAVLQRDRKVPIWGDAPANTKVEILLGDKKTTAIADANGHWSAKVGPHKASVGHTLVVSTQNQKKRAIISLLVTFGFAAVSRTWSGVYSGVLLLSLLITPKSKQRMRTFRRFDF